MIAQIRCKDCDIETSAHGYVVRKDLKYTKLAYLLNTKLKTEKNFDAWLKSKEEDGTAYYKTDKLRFEGDEFLVIDGEEVLDEFQRWEQSGCKCPICGSKNCYWF